jgi:hypothetical protein
MQPDPETKQDTDTDDDLIIVETYTAHSKPSTRKRSNPFASPTPTRRSKRGSADFQPICLADEDETHPPREYRLVPNPEQNVVIQRRRSPRPYGWLGDG